MNTNPRQVEQRCSFGGQVPPVPWRVKFERPDHIPLPQKLNPTGLLSGKDMTFAEARNYFNEQIADHASMVKSDLPIDFRDATVHRYAEWYRDLRDLREMFQGMAEEDEKRVLECLEEDS